MRINFKNKISFTRQRLGFTLVELLVVIAILGILATLIIVATNESRARGRDARRTADVKVMSDALELYVEDNVVAPVIDAQSGNVWGTVIEQISGYIRGGSTPLDPQEENGYHYVICSSGGEDNYPKSNFLVAAVMEVDYTTKGITGDLDGAHGYDIQGGRCMTSNDTAPMLLNCSDDGDATPVGVIDEKYGSVLCMGYYRND